MKPLELAKFLYVQRVKGFDPPGDEPWMDPEGAARFEAEIARASRYLEFGSGGTTVVADRLGVPTVSVETDRFYARAVAGKLRSGAVRQLAVPMGLTGEWGYPVFESRRKARRYVTAPFGDEPFPDFILVDGRYRVACALESARRAKARGARATLMIDDYAWRSSYHCVEDHLGTPEIAGRTALFTIGSQSVPEEAVDAALTDPV